MKINQRAIIWFIIALVVIVILAVFIPETIKKNGENVLSAQEFLAYKTDYIGDASKVGGIISLLEYPEHFSNDYFELNTNEHPYMVTIYVKAESERTYMSFTVEEQKLFEKNAMLLFSLIGNVDVVNFVNTNDEMEEELRYTREFANVGFDKDLREFAKSEAAFNQLLEMLAKQ